MKLISNKYKVDHYLLKDDGRFPNNDKLELLVYKNVLNVPIFFPALKIKNFLKRNNWSNAWKAGIYKYHHYHSITHELLACIKGSTQLLLGGENGLILEFSKGDVIVIPAGVAHKNLGKQNAITCIGAYPDGKSFDMNYGKKGERPLADQNIKNVPIPSKDPITGENGEMQKIWVKKKKAKKSRVLI